MSPLYVPHLFTKPAELRALGAVPLEVKRSVLPCLIWTQIKTPYSDPLAPREVDVHIEKTLNLLPGKWDRPSLFWEGQPIFFDMGSFDKRLRTSSGACPLEVIFDRFRQWGFLSIPVTLLQCTPVQKVTVKEIIEQDQRGCCFRILASELTNPALKRTLENELHSLDISLNQTDIIIDWGYIQRKPREDLELVRKFPHLLNWRSVTVTGGSIPETMSRFDRGMTRGHRPEWEMWLENFRDARSIGREIKFGDYATRHPEYSVNFEGFQSSPNARYTTYRGIDIYKEKRTKEDIRASQFKRIATSISNSNEFSGHKFSAGDRSVYRIARGLEAPDDTQKWIEMDENHHITFVAREISRLLAGIAAAAE